MEPSGSLVLRRYDSQPRRDWADYHRSGMDELIGSFNLVYSLLAAWKLGLLQALMQRPNSSVAELSSRHDCRLVGHLLDYLRIKNVVNMDADRFWLTEEGLDLASEASLAQLEFYVEAYGPVVSQLTGLIDGSKAYGAEVARDGAALGRSCAHLFRLFHNPIVLEVLAALDVRKVLDLGCGAGQFLLDACRDNPELQAVGLDIDEPSIAIAQGLTQQRGLAERLKFVVADAFQPDSWPAETDDVDAIFGVGVLHEHFRDGEGAVLSILGRMADKLRSGAIKTFILGEPELYYDDQENDADLYLVHIFTKQGFPRRRELWLDLFERSPVTCRRIWTRPGAGPRFAFYDLVPRD